MGVGFNSSIVTAQNDHSPDSKHSINANANSNANAKVSVEPNMYVY